MPDEFSRNPVPPLKKLAGVRCFVLDMDGTVYLGERLLPGAADFLSLCREQEIGTLFLTNNSSKSRADYGAKLRRLGLDVPDEAVLTSGEAAASYLARAYPGRRIYVAGTPALEQEAAAQGLVLDAECPDVVLLGFDTGLTYARLTRLCDLVRAGLPTIATHPDLNCPVEGGFIPDIGATIAFVEASTGRRPDLIIGKPYPPIVEALADKANLPVNALCMIGDRLYTDIALGAAGLMTVLVLSGETAREDVSKSPHQPDLVVENLAELTDLLSGEL